MTSSSPTPGAAAPSQASDWANPDGDGTVRPTIVPKHAVMPLDGGELRNCFQ